MILNWRGKEYLFTNRTIESFRDSDRGGNIAAPIYGADTESCYFPAGPGRPAAYRPICFQISGATRGESLHWLSDAADPLGDFLDCMYERLLDDLDHGHKKAFVYFHNMEYDMGQLFKQHAGLIGILRTGIGIADEIVLSEGRYKATLMKGGLFKGKSPFFEIKFFESRRRQITVNFRDTFSFFPSSLSKVGAMLNLPVLKEKHPHFIGKIDYRKAKPKSKRAFESYSKRDALVTRLAAEKIRQLHIDSGMERIRISAPSYAVTKLVQAMPEDGQLQSGCNDTDTMQLVVDSYKGGRTGGIHHGPVSNLAVLDIHSSYPASMMTLPSFSPTMEYMRYTEDDGPIDIAEFIDLCNTIPLFARIDGIESDEKYPCTIVINKGKLTPVYGFFENLPTTGVEIMVGIKSGTLTITRVREFVILMEQDEPEYNPMSGFIESEYRRKESAEPDSVEYLGAKLGMNGCYGKLIESRRENFIDAENGSIILPYDENDESFWGNAYYTQYIKMLDDGTDDFENYLGDDMVEAFAASIQNKEGGKLEWAELGSIGLTKLKYGRYAIPAAAALITATSRARLLVGMKALSALYWDTDSLFLNEYDPDAARQKLAQADWLPSYIQPVVIGDRLGDFGPEILNASGWLAGTKRYYLIGTDPKSGKPKRKAAIHGISDFDRDHTSEVIESLATGDDFEYTGKGRPTSAKQAKTLDEIGQWKYTKFNSRFKLDDRLQWFRKGDSWIGRVKEFIVKG